MPGVSLMSEEAEPRRAKLTAEEILDAVSAQAEEVGLDAPEATPFNERSTTDIETAFTARNTMLPQASGNSEHPGNDLLKELESMSAPSYGDSPPPAEPESSAAEPPVFVKPDPAAFLKKSQESPAKAPPPSRNLLRELESMTVEPTEEAEQEPQQPALDSASQAPDANSFFESLSSVSAVRRPGMPPPPADAEEADDQEPEPQPEQPSQLDDEDESTQQPDLTPAEDDAKIAQEMAEPEPAMAAASEVEPADQPPPAPALKEVSNAPETPFNSQALEGSRQDYSERAPAPPTQAHSSDNNKTKVESSGEAIPEAKDLIKKMEEMTKTVAPDWCLAFSFPDLEELKQERDALAETIRQTQGKITAIDNKIGVLDSLKNALLGAEGEELKAACSRVFKRIGWVARQSDSERNELLLVGHDKAEVIARIVRSTGQAPRVDIASLAQSVLTFWGETEIEPKGLLVAATWINHPPKERSESDFTDAMADFAQKKSLCLMTTIQLLCMYRDLELGKVGSEEIRRKLIDTNGRLIGFNLEPAKTTA